MTIAKAIKIYRLKQGLTQLDLAIRINRSTRCVMRYEKGETIPSMKILSQIFNISVDEVLISGLIRKGAI